MKYIIKKQDGGQRNLWAICEHYHKNVIGTYPTRKQAVTVARILAGWGGSVTFACDKEMVK